MRALRGSSAIVPFAVSVPSRRARNEQVQVSMQDSWQGPSQTRRRTGCSRACRSDRGRRRCRRPRCCRSCRCGGADRFGCGRRLLGRVRHGTARFQYVDADARKAAAAVCSNWYWCRSRRALPVLYVALLPLLRPRRPVSTHVAPTADDVTDLMPPSQECQPIQPCARRHGAGTQKRIHNGILSVYFGLSCVYSIAARPSCNCLVFSEARPSSNTWMKTCGPPAWMHGNCRPAHASVL